MRSREETLWVSMRIFLLFFVYPPVFVLLWKFLASCTCSDFFQAVSSDTPEPWGLFFQNNATPQMEGLEELHNNIMFYLAIILFSVTWFIISTIIYIKWGDIGSNLKSTDKESEDEEYVLKSNIMWTIVAFFFVSEVILAVGSILEFLPFYGVNRNFDDNEFLRGLYPNHNLDEDNRIHYIYFLAEQLALINTYLLGIIERFHELEPWEHELADWEHFTVELRVRLILMRAELRTIFLGLTNQDVHLNPALHAAHDALLRQYEVFDDRMRQILDYYRDHPSFRGREYQWDYNFHMGNRIATILTLSFFMIFAAGATCLPVPTMNFTISY